MSSVKKPGFFRSLLPIVTPPFDGLWLLVTLYYGWCFFVFPHSQTLRGNLPDPDDYMYLAQIHDWLNGQGWFDNVQQRLNPPEGTPIHFSRFAQAPIAGIIWVIRKFGLGFEGAGTIAAMIYPLILLSGLLLTLRFMAESFMPKKWAGVTAYTALFATGMMFMFMPGHIDHHGLIVLLLALTLAFVIRMFNEPDEPRWGIGAGFVMALALTVALEILPCLLLVSAWVGLWAVVKGGNAARSALGYALSLYVVSLAFLALTRVPSQFFTADVLTYSITYVMLTGGIAVAFAGIAITADSKPAWRWIAGAGLAILTGGLFLHRFPELISGPYGGMNPELAQLMLGEIDEASPLIKLGQSFLGIAVRIAGSLIALVATFIFLKNAKPQERWNWGLLFLILVSCFLLTMFYEYRFMAIMGLMTVIPMAVLLQRGWAWAATLSDGKPGSERKRFFAEIGFLLLVGPLPSVLFPALVDGRSFSTGFLLFPVDASVTGTTCDTFALEQILDMPRIYGGRPRLIMSSMGQGPELLFRTPHKILSAPFHMDVSGNIDATRFFSTPYESEAEAIARRRGVDLVVTCRAVPRIYMRPPAGEKPQEGNDSHDFAPHFVELLMTDKQPDWLKPIHFRGLSNYSIFEVHLPPENGAAPPAPASTSPTPLTK
jgi:hypothetical protein